VLPAVTGQGYKELDIADGALAGIAYLRVLYGKASKEERTKVFQDLEKYCALDTEGMIWIVDFLRKVVSPQESIKD